MAAVNRGYGATLGAANEVTFGTPVTRAVWLRMASLDFMRKRTKEAVEHLGSLGKVSANYQHEIITSDNVDGTVRWPIAYDDGSIFMLRQGLGAAADAGGPTYTHTLTFAQPAPNSLTLEAINGTPAAGGGFMAEVFDGCVPTRTTLTFENGKTAMAEMQFFGRTSGGLVAPSAVTYSPGGEYIRHNHAGSFTFNAIARPIRALKLTIDRGVERNQELGSLFTSLPIEASPMIEAEVTTMWQQSAWDAEYLNDTVGDATISFTGTGVRALAATLHNARVTDVSRPVSTMGGIQQTIKLRMAADTLLTGDQGLQLVFTNTSALYSAN